MQPTQKPASFPSRVKTSGLLSSAQWAEWSQGPSAETASETDLAKSLISRGWLTRFQAERLLEGRTRGFFFDHYRVEDILGVGGMGWVYRAIDVRTGQQLALKVLQEQFKADQGLQARFLQEARVGLLLQHPHIVRTYDMGSAGGLPYVTMGLIRGASLLELILRRRYIPWPEACEYIRQAASALAYAHQLGLVHRDVKPQNLLVDEAGQVRLLDFGLAMKCEGSTGDEFSMAMIFGHESVGTVEFAAPEQADNSLAADARSDIYSLGGTLFAALTGELPFRVSSRDELLDAHKFKPPRNVTELVPEIPSEVAAIVKRMLAKQPTERFATANDVVDALTPWAKPAEVHFDFAGILAERQLQARRKLKQLHRQQASSPAMSNSTARPTMTSSVAQISEETAAKFDQASSVVRLSTELAGELLPSAPPASTVRSAESSSPHELTSKAALIAVGSTERIPLSLDTWVIGRQPGCQLVADDGGVSGRHCELRYDGQQWWLMDLNSRNGTFVNRVQIKQHALVDGDEIQIGRHLRYRFDDGTGSQKNGARGRFWWMLAAAVFTLALLGGLAVAWLWQ
ncbi:protein kinase [bacterium]|nr:protein kinase [bacterium]